VTRKTAIAANNSFADFMAVHSQTDGCLQHREVLRSQGWTLIQVGWVQRPHSGEIEIEGVNLVGTAVADKKWCVGGIKAAPAGVQLRQIL
jgi:hypothetical protein